MFTAPGHPGFPQDSDLIEDNKFYSNNFNPYLPLCRQKAGPNGPTGLLDITPTVPVPVGTGLWIAGGNNNIIRNNRFWDNWRRGTMLFAVPDAFVCDDPNDQLPGCEPTGLLDLVPQPDLRQPDGPGARRVACAAERRGLLVGPGRAQQHRHE